MNNQKTFLIVGSGLLGIIALSLVFMAWKMSENCWPIAGNWSIMMNEWRMMGWFFNQDGRWKWQGMMNQEMNFIDETSLSDEQKTQLEQIREDQQEEMQNLMQSLRKSSSTGDDQETITKINELWKTHMTAIRPFVSQDNLADFDAFVAEGKPGSMGMMWKRWLRK